MSIVKSLAITCAVLLTTVWMTVASAAEVTVFSTIGVRSALEEIAPKFESATGHRLKLDFAVSAILVKRVQAGETADVVVLTRSGLDKLGKAGIVAIGPDADIASSVIAVVVKHGAPKPDISTPDAFKQALLNAKSIAFSDPAAGGTSGVYIGKLLERMGIAGQMKTRIKHPPPSGNAALLVASGEAGLAIQQQPELMSAAGVDLVGPLPDDINLVTTFSGGITTGSRQSSAGAALIKFLHSPEAVAVFESKGLTPAAAPGAM